MSEPLGRTAIPQTGDLAEVRALYEHLLLAWNQRNADGYAALFAEDCEVVGFDGSHMRGPSKIAATLGQIFAHHVTPVYVSIVRSVRLLGPGVALLRADVGMVPAGQSDLNPQLNAVQVLVAARIGGEWRIVSFQNTPAQFHGRPELVQQLTDELKRQLGR